MNDLEIGPLDVKKRLQERAEFLLLDVRTEEELEIASIEGATHLPLHELDADHPVLADWREKEIVCLCHHGGRSEMAQRYLIQNGYQNVKNFVGGINAWALEVDDGMARY
jgi:rhodanese-related sulfurtransferase